MRAASKPRPDLGWHRSTTRGRMLHISACRTLVKTMPRASGNGKPERTRRLGLRPVLLALIVVLYVISIPWYRGDDQELRLLLGLPDWVAVAILCYALVAVLNSVVWMRTPIEDDAPLSRALTSRALTGGTKGMGAPGTGRPTPDPGDSTP
jgi:hypothetical protein